jgi:hypothetical protein
VLLDYDETDGRFRVTCSGLKPGFAPGIILKVVLLPHQVRGTAVAAELVHHGSSTMVVIATVQDTDHSLMVHAVAWEDLALADHLTEVNQVKTLTLGIAVASQVGAAVARMRLGSDDQQLGLAWADTQITRRGQEFSSGNSWVDEPSWTCQIALVGWGADGQFAVLARAAPDLSVAHPLIPLTPWRPPTSSRPANSSC